MLLNGETEARNARAFQSDWQSDEARVVALLEAAGGETTLSHLLVGFAARGGSWDGALSDLLLTVRRMERAGRVAADAEDHSATVVRLRPGEGG